MGSASEPSGGAGGPDSTLSYGQVPDRGHGTEPGSGTPSLDLNLVPYLDLDMNLDLDQHLWF